MLAWRRSHTNAALTVMAALLFAPLALAGPRPQTPPTPAAGPLAWAPCGEPLPPALECAELEVPLDPDDPAAGTTTLGLSRLPATGPDEPIGPLLFNPGGPGGAASDFLAAEAAGAPVFSRELRARFDIVGFDPRGVGLSEPVRCDAALWNARDEWFPEDAAAFDAMLAANVSLGASCLELSGPLLAHIDTMSAARGVEAVRLALGGEPLTWLGLSYGTMLGAMYASMYPGNIRAMALDGALAYPLSPTTMLADEALAYRDAFGRFADWCAETADCALHGEDAAAVFAQLAARADAAPIPAPGCAAGGACRAEVSGDDLRLNAQQFLLTPHPAPQIGLPGWPGLARAIADARAGDASAFSMPLAQDDASPLFPALAISCLDWQSPVGSFDDLRAMEMLGETIADPLDGASQTWGIQAGCAGWPVRGEDAGDPLRVTGAPPILIVNATHDPSTSYAWAHGMLEAIDGAVLLTREGDGHTSFLQPRPSATLEAIDRYLIDLELPAPNTVLRD